VSGIQRIGDVNGDRKKLLRFHWTPCDVVLQRHAIEEFHGDEGAALLFAYVIDRADIGVVERGGGPRFASEALQRLRIVGHGIGQELEGDEPAEPGVFGLVDHTHPAAA
jgi:hypothetical protein